jgi:hypothetical protein
MIDIKNQKEINEMFKKVFDIIDEEEISNDDTKLRK